jgi:hypothetical protein
MEDMEDNRRLLNAVQGTADLKVQEASDLREAYLWDNSSRSTRAWPCGTRKR